MIKLRDEKLIDKIMKDIDEDYYSANEMRELLTKNLTHPTDEAIEKPTDRIEKARKYYKENTKKYINPEDSFRKAILDNMPNEVKPPTKDTIEKIGDFKDLYSFPNNPRVGQTCAGYIWNGEHRLEQGFDYMKFECLRTKYNELVDTVNHQQEQIQQLLSGTDKNE